MDSGNCMQDGYRAKSINVYFNTIIPKVLCPLLLLNHDIIVQKGEDLSKTYPTHNLSIPHTFLSLGTTIKGWLPFSMPSLFFPSYAGKIFYYPLKIPHLSNGLVIQIAPSYIRTYFVFILLNVIDNV